MLLVDVDGVLTDGGMYYSEKGDIMKKFHTRDGMGVTLLRQKGIHTIIITKEKTKMVQQWAKKMKIFKLYEGIKQKEKMLEKISVKLKIKPEEMAFIGDDINDMGLLKMVGFSAAPNDATEKVKKICSYICKKNGGEGVLREIADKILETK